MVCFALFIFRSPFSDIVILDFGHWTSAGHPKHPGQRGAVLTQPREQRPPHTRSQAHRRSTSKMVMHVRCFSSVFVSSFPTCIFGICTISDIGTPGTRATAGHCPSWISRSTTSIMSRNRASSSSAMQSHLSAPFSGRARMDFKTGRACRAV